MSAACPVCGAPEAGLRYRLTRFSIFACARCGQVFLAPVPSEAEIEVLFRTLYTKGDPALPELRGYYDFCYEDSPTNPLVQCYVHWLKALERVHPPGTLLDVGCGAGLFCLVARRRGWQVTGIDGSVEATRHARERFGLPVQTGDFTAFATDGRVFDVVTMWDIIEHARDPVGLLRAVRRALAPGGIVGLSTPNRKSILDLVAGGLYRASGGRLRAPLEKFYIEQHFLYFEPATLGRALARADLQITHLARESTDLRRLQLSVPRRALLRGLFGVASLVGLENRLFAVARPASA